MADTYLLNSPLINYIHYSTGENVGDLADAGTIEFFDAADHSSQLDTYADAAGTIPNPNPIVLTAVGSWPPVYLKDQKYYIVIKDKYENVIETLDNYIPNGGQSGGGGDVTKASTNLISDGQFQFSQEFWKKSDPVGLVKSTPVSIAWAWIFTTDAASTTKNLITYSSLADTPIEGNPAQEMVLASSSIMTGESSKDFYTPFADITAFSGESITISLQAINKLSGTVPIEVILVKTYGSGGSEGDTLRVTTFNVSTTRTKYSFTYTMPTNAGKTIGTGDASISLYLRIGVGQICTVGITNVLILPGSVSNPIYPELASGLKAAATIAENFPISQATLATQFNRYIYLNGVIQEYSVTGTYSLSMIGQEQADQYLCDGRTLAVADYSNDNLPYRRLYNVIGQQFGGGGDLVVTSSDNVVKFDSHEGAREHSPYTAGTLGGSVTVTNTQVGLPGGVRLTRSANVITFDFSMFSYTPDPTPTLSNGVSIPSGALGSWFNASGYVYPTTIPNPLVVTQVSATSATVTYNSSSLTDYYTRVASTSDDHIGPLNIFEWGTSENNARGTWVTDDPGSPTPGGGFIWFTLPGHSSGGDSPYPYPTVPPSSYGINFQLDPSLTVDANMDKLIEAISAPFEWTVTFNAVPTASQYLEYSSDALDYYAWYTVDGVGTDPAVPNRQAVNVAINSTDSTTVVATKTAAALNSLNFALPTAADLPAIPAASASKLAYYIYG